MADVVAVDFENGAHMVLSKLVDGSAVKRVQVGDEVFVRELGTDVKHAYDRGWIAGWNAQHGDPNAARRVSTAVVIGPPGTDPGEATISPSGNPPTVADLERALAGNYRVTFNPDGSLHAVPLEVTRG